MYLNRILVATDFSDASLPAVKTAFMLATENSATLWLLNVIEHAPPSAMVDLTESNMKRLNHLIPRNWRQLESGLEVKRTVLFGEPAEKIVGLAREAKVDLIVVGTHGRKGLAHMLMGSTAEKVLREAPCQVLVVKPQPEVMAES